MVNLSKMLPACGFAIAVALVAVTSAFKDAPKTKSGDTEYTFVYQPPSANDYSAESVQDLSNWVAVDEPESCNGTLKACSIEAPDTYVDETGSQPALESSITLQTQSDPMSGETRVASVAQGATFANKN